jgi:hypothetical protein
MTVRRGMRFLDIGFARSFLQVGKNILHREFAYATTWGVSLTRSIIDDTEVVNPNAMFERSRFVRLTVFIPEKDETHPEATLYVEQRVYEGVHEKVLIHELLFGGQIQVGIEYLFPGCGDEDPRLGKRDLRLKFQSVSITIIRLPYY